jgi:hypothetical protein
VFTDPDPGNNQDGEIIYYSAPASFPNEEEPVEKAQALNPSAVVFPNPTQSTSTLQVLDLEGDISINIYSTTGQLVNEVEIQKNKLSNGEIELNNYESGVYYIHIQSTNFQKTLSWVVH